MRSVLLLLAAARAQSLFEIPEGVENRWASGENPTGEKGKAAQANGGRKGSATVAVKAGTSRTHAEEANSRAAAEEV